MIIIIVQPGYNLQVIFFNNCTTIRQYNIFSILDHILIMKECLTPDIFTEGREGLMKRIITLSTLLLLTTANYIYAESMRMTIINDSSATQNLSLGPVNQIVHLGPGEVKMLTVD